MDMCKSIRSKTHRNTTFTWLEHARPGTKSHAVIGKPSRASYSDHVTVYPYSGYIRSTNPIVRHVMSLAHTLKRVPANQCAAKHAATRSLRGSYKRARAPKRSRNRNLAPQRLLLDADQVLRAESGAKLHFSVELDPIKVQPVKVAARYFMFTKVLS